jgi:hypothetical protein
LIGIILTKMADKLISGKELLDNFFDELPNLENTDPEITAQLKELYASDKFTERGIINLLNELKAKS